MKKICKNCKYYKAKQGRYGAGKCVADKSRKHNKDLVLEGDKCKEWVRKNDRIRR